jgi:Protein of unknown function (DUF3168)
VIRLAIASIELQKAIYAALNKGEYPVFEVVPPNTKFPYIALGEEVVTDSDTKTNKRTVHNFTIHTWSKGSSSTESKVINDIVKQSLLDGISVNGFSMDLITLEMLTAMKEQGADGTVFHGVHQYEITLTMED